MLMRASWGLSYQVKTHPLGTAIDGKSMISDFPVINGNAEAVVESRQNPPVCCGGLFSC